MAPLHREHLEILRRRLLLMGSKAIKKIANSGEIESLSQIAHRTIPVTTRGEELMMAEKKLWKNCNRFSEKLGQKMLQLGLNGQKLARKSDVSDSEISRIMNGKSLPGLENAMALARSVEVSLDYLADDKIDHDPSRPQESASESELMILRLVRELGSMQAFNLLENTRIIGYELAMKRLIEAKPTVEAPRPSVTPVASRVGTA